MPSQAMNKLLCENGVYYSTKPSNTLIRFSYHWKHEQKQGETTIWCLGKLDFLRLLNHWNRTGRDDHWHYWSDEI